MLAGLSGWWRLARPHSTKAGPLQRLAVLPKPCACGMAGTQAGFDYPAADCRSWMTEVGFRNSYTEPLAGPDSMVVGIK